jgi:hypothetical protein
MVTSESNRGQAVVATPPFERQTQVSPPSPEAPAPPSSVQPPAEERLPTGLREPFALMSLVVSGATIGSMWALGATVLAILALAGVAPVFTLPAAAILVGLALLTLGGIDRLWAQMFPFAEGETRRDRTIFSSSIWVVIAAGLLGAIVGIVNLTRFTDPRFVAIAAIVLGLGLFCHSEIMRRVSRFPYHGVEGRQLRGPLALNALTLAPLRDFLVGLVGVVLGVLAIFNLAPIALGAVALLAMSIAAVATTSTICSATLATLEGSCSKKAG